MSSEGRRIWSINICCATSLINTSSFTLLMILRTFLTPLILIWQLTHYDSHTALRQYPTPHRVKSSDQVIFPFLSQFSHDESLFFILLLIFFLIYHLIHHAVLKRNFLEFSSDSLMSNCLQISEMLLSHSCLPPIYKEAVLPQRKDNQLQVLFSAQLSSVRSKYLTILITTSGFVSNSHQGLDHFDYIIRVCSSYFIKLTSAQGLKG